MKGLLFLFCMVLSDALIGQVTDGFNDGDFTTNPTWSGDDIEFQINSEELQLFDDKADDSHLMTASSVVDDGVWEFLFRWEGFSSTGLSSSNEVFFYLVANQNAAPETNDIEGYVVRIGNTEDEISFYRQDTDLSSLTELIDGNSNGFGDVTESTSGSIRVRVSRDDAGNWTLEADVSGGTTFSEVGMVTDATYTTGAFTGIFIDYSAGNAAGYFFDDIQVSSSAGPDTDPPTIQSVTAVSETEVDIQFNENVDVTTAQNISNYAIDSSIGVINAVLDASNSLVHLTTSSLSNGSSYTITINNVEDESENKIAPDSEFNFEYLVFEEAVEFDVVINEFLSNPVDNNNDFIELYNNSNKFIDMEGWNISDKSSTSEDLTSFILRPGEFLIIYDEDATIDYSSFGNSLTIASLTLNNSDDQIEIVSGMDVRIDFLAYYEEQEDGVSLELRNPNTPCLSLDSYSLSIDPSGSTPGIQNSVFDNTPDTEAPIIQSYNFDTNLTINFSEVMDAVSLAIGSYAVTGGVTINEVIVTGELPSSVEVSFNGAIEVGTLYDFMLADVTDCAGNIIEETIITFGVGRSPSFNELIITELMFDPDPQVELPNQEFIEVYNATSNILTTAGIHFTDASSTVEIPTRVLNPGEYYVLTANSAASEFSGNVIGVPSFPSLNNSGEKLTLSLDNELIFSLTYDPDWHEEEKSSGGYTLEMKDVTNPCLDNGNNWVSSQDVNGGTPGLANSVSEVIPDNFGPEIIMATAVSSDSIRIEFNEKIDPTSVAIASVLLSPSVTIDRMVFDINNPSILAIKLSEALEQNIPYSLNIGNVTDCSGNEIQQGEVVFALPVLAELNEIKLSEVLFNPRSNGVDFVEIFNDSEKYISLKNWKLGKFDEEGMVDDTEVLTDNELVIAPGQYLVFTTDANVLLSNYPKGQHASFFEVASLPSFPNDEGSVLLIDQSETIVETFEYNEDYHYDLLENLDGVSLERVSYEESANNSDNWRSAASTEGFATPGYLNSQSFKSDITIGRVTASPEVFIPENVGSGRDFTTINYQFDQPGQFANVNIYDQRGRLVKNLAQGVLLSRAGFLRWDGDTNDGKTARMGYHLIIFEIYGSSGNSEIIKETVVVGRNF